MADYVGDAGSGAATGATIGGPWGALAGAIIGLGKGYMDSKKEDKDRKIQAETTRYSPWTHMQAAAPQRADFLGSAMQGGMTGAAMGQNVNNSNQQNALLQSQQNYWDKMLKQQTAPAPQMAGGYAGYGAGIPQRPDYVPPGG